MMDTKLEHIKDWRFFMEWAGYCTPPGKVVCAWQSVVAELEAKARGLTFEWEYDQSGLDLTPDFGDAHMNKEWASKEHECLEVLAYDAAGNVRASLCGIWDADFNYRRVVEAELASEAIHELKQEQAEYQRRNGLMVSRYV